MRHYAEIEATARDVPAFSNGTQGYGWMANWCDRCIHDDLRCIEFRDKDNPGPSEPQPIPDPPGQELLLPREPFEGARMFVRRTPVEVAS